MSVFFVMPVLKPVILTNSMHRIDKSQLPCFQDFASLEHEHSIPDIRPYGRILI